MAKIELVDIPKVTSGRAPKPNPYTEHMELMKQAPEGKGIKFVPEEDHSPQVVARRLRALAPENRTVRTKHDPESNTVQAWLAPKKAKPVAPETVAAKMDAKGDTPDAPKADAKSEPAKTNARKGAA